MQSSIMLWYSVIVWLSTINLCDSQIIFGFETSSLNNSTNSVSKTSGVITMTLYWSTSKYQCNIIYPSRSNNTYYSCNTLNITNTFECDTNLPSSWSLYGNKSYYALQIDNHQDNTIQIHKIIITNYTNNITLVFQYFCLTQSLHCDWKSTLFITSNLKYTLIEFDYDTNISYNQITNELECDVYNVTSSTPCIPIGYGCIDVFKTPLYGGNGVSLNIAFNEGKVYGMQSWGTCKFDGEVHNPICQIQWKTDKQNISDVFGVGIDTINIQKCAPFQLDDDDYINGFRVIYDKFVNGIYFYTLNNKTYHCGSTALTPPPWFWNYSNYSYYNYYYNYYEDNTGNVDTGIIHYVDEYFLSGFDIYSGLVLDSISFQFTSINHSHSTECTHFHKYILVQSQKSWSNARAVCNEQYSSELATIITDQDLKIAIAIIDIYDDVYIEDDIWIGLTSQSVVTKQKDRWEWTDDTSCEYTDSGLCEDDDHWMKHEFTDNRQCASIGRLYINGLFNTHDCDKQLIFLCNNGTYIEKTTTNRPSSTGILSTEISSTATVFISDTALTVIIIVGIVNICIVIICMIACWNKSRIKKQMRDTRYSSNTNEDSIGLEYMRMSEAEHVFSK